MTDLFKKSYSQFLGGKTNLEEFKGFRESLNRLSDAELSAHLKNTWTEESNFPAMDADRKQYIRERLFFRIYPLRGKRFARWQRIAAAVAVILLVSATVWNVFTLYRAETSAPFLAEVPAGNKVQLTLPDKSIVKLNSESSLSYVYRNGQRLASLYGEAYFDVKKDKKHPFLVRIDNLTIEVVGTSFNVRSYKESDCIETSLVEGSIRLYDSHFPAETFLLKPSQKAVYSKKSRKIHFYSTNNERETAWTRGHLVFESETLSAVFQRIERWYGVKITLLCPEIANDRISGSFKNEQLPYVMEALKMQYGFQYEITGNKITINKSANLKKKMLMK